MIYGGSPIDVDTLKNPNIDSPMLDVDTIFVAYGDITIVEYIKDYVSLLGVLPIRCQR